MANIGYLYIEHEVVMANIGYGYIEHAVPKRFRLRRANGDEITTRVVGRWELVEDRATRKGYDLLGFVLELEGGERVTLPELMHRWGDETVSLVDAEDWD